MEAPTEPADPRRPASEGPYASLKVLDFTWAAAGPVATTLLAFLGADVVKVEHSSRPDLMRVSDRQYGYGSGTGINESPLFNELNGGKRSIELDLGVEADRQTVVELASVADVLIENMRPGKMERLGLGYDDLATRNPRLVMCSVSATGRSAVAGPPGYAPIFWAEGGGAWLTGWPHRPPGLVRGPIDLHAAAFACLGIMAMLRDREHTGLGGYLDCSAVEAVAATLGVPLLEAQIGGDEPGRQGNAFPGALVNDVFPCLGEDEWLALTLVDDADVARFVAAIDGEFGLTLSAAEVTDQEKGWIRVADATADLKAEALERCLQAAGVAAARSISLRSAMSDERLLGRQALQPIRDEDGAQIIVGLPWRRDGVAYAVPGPAPSLGGNGEDVRREWLGPP